MEKRNKKKRTLVMGDIHGGYKAMLQVLKRANFDKNTDLLIQLGDVSDGWPETVECVGYLLTLPNLISITGNHDVWTYEYLNFGTEATMHVNQGGKATIESYKNAMLNDEEYRKHVKFFRNQSPFYIDDENRGFVHGGFQSRLGLGHDPFRSNYWWDRDLITLANMMHKDYIAENLDIDLDIDGPSHATRFLKHKEIYIGHTATTMYKNKPHLPEWSDSNQPKSGNIIIPMNRCNIWNLDTGAGFSGKLSVMDIDTKEYWQSDFVSDLYPNSKGR